MSLPPQDLPPARRGLIAVSYVIFRHADAVLLQQRRGTGFLDGYWGAAAAGHLENGESAVAAAIREAGEELGVLVREEHLHPLTVLQRPAAVKDQPAASTSFSNAAPGWAHPRSRSRTKPWIFAGSGSMTCQSPWCPTKRWSLNNGACHCRPSPASLPSGRYPDELIPGLGGSVEQSQNKIPVCRVW